MQKHPYPLIKESDADLIVLFWLPFEHPHDRRSSTFYPLLPKVLPIVAVTL
jgi:hypothetical protein